MNLAYSCYELLWLFLIYSFLGWLSETIAAAIKQKRFVNRGLVNSPFCVLYGITAVFITIFCGELHGFWLFLGAALLATVFEWSAGRLIEAFYHERWWDYSKTRWNFDGYICLQASILWGFLGYIMMKWGNGLFLQLFRLIPKIGTTVLIWALVILLILDVAATLIVAHGKSHNIAHWRAVDNWFTNMTSRLGAPIYKHIDTRIHKAYPEAKPVKKVKSGSNVFAYGCSFHKIIWLFMIGAFLGDITETIFCRVTAGVWMSRSSVVWGPFSIVWGLAIAAFTVLLYRYRNHSDRFLFLAGTFLGGAYEYICSVFTELVFGKVF